MVSGIVCEYNPFHKGHLYHIEKVKEAGADYIVCVMSGNFVQRGECAYFDKWTRAKAAVKCGADVVIDLPVPWSCSSAENFARGSIGLLCNFGIDMLSFGSESDDTDSLVKCALATYEDRIQHLLVNMMSKGYSYPAALSYAVGTVYGEETSELLSTPNSTLAVEYIKALRTRNKNISLLPVKRVGAEHDSDKICEGFVSASKIRETDEIEFMSRFIPAKAFECFADAERYKMKNADRAVLSALREKSREEYDLYVSDSTGLSARIYEAVKTSSNLDELYTKAKSKNYTHSRIRREVMNIYLQIPKDTAVKEVPYMRILAVSENGVNLLSKAKENSSVPVVTRHREMLSLNDEAQTIYDLQCKSSDKFALFSDKAGLCSAEQINSMKIIKR